MNQVTSLNISVWGRKFKSMVSIERRGLAYNFQGVSNSPCEFVFLFSCNFPLFLFYHPDCRVRNNIQGFRHFIFKMQSPKNTLISCSLTARTEIFRLREGGKYFLVSVKFPTRCVTRRKTLEFARSLMNIIGDREYEYQGGAVASWLVRSTTERAVRVQALAGDIVLCSWARHFTLTVPLSTQLYKCVPANRWENLTNCGEVTCDGLAPRTEAVEILLAASCYRNRDKLRQL